MSVIICLNVVILSCKDRNSCPCTVTVTLKYAWGRKVVEFKETAPNLQNFVKNYIHIWASVIWYIHLFSFWGVNDLLPFLCMFSLLHQKGSNENKQNHLNLQVTAQFWLHMTNFSLDTVLTEMLLCLFSFLTSLWFF